MNTYSKQGSDKTGSIILHLGQGDGYDDELLGFEVAPSIVGVSNRHTIIGEAPDGGVGTSSVSGAPKNYPLHPAYRASHAASIARYGVWETAESAAGASTSAILSRAAQAVVAANIDPVTSFKVTLDPDLAPAFGPRYTPAASGPRSGGTFADDAGVGTEIFENPGNAASSNDVYAKSFVDSLHPNTHYLKATNFGFFACSSTPSCSTGSMFARKTKSDSAQPAGSFGLKSWNTFSCVSSVVRVEKSGA